jgi:Fe-S-cluster containining protein
LHSLRYVAKQHLLISWMNSIAKERAVLWRYSPYWRRAVGRLNTVVAGVANARMHIYEANRSRNHLVSIRAGCARVKLSAAQTRRDSETPAYNVPNSRKVIPIKAVAAAKSAKRVNYDCAKCPAYCCSYALIETGKRDIARLAKHFGVSYGEAERRFTKYDRDAKVRTLRHQKDEHFSQVCQFLDTEKRRCTVYEARPAVCRDYPDAKRCGYYDFLQFEREQQGDPKFVATT